MYQAVCINGDTKAGMGELMWVTRSAPPNCVVMFATQDEATRTCAWDAKHFIAELNIHLYYFHCNVTTEVSNLQS